ncbi:MAG: C1 family peptidase [Bacteroidales bacterium]|nr:C1 family peptidase [Bacteroidales bacterium]
MFRYFLLPAILFIAVNNFGNAQDIGTIDKELIEQFRGTFNADKSTKAIMNAVSSNDIKNLALNRENLGKVDNYFSNRVESKGITDQKSTGRCWLFTGLNVIRAEVINEKNMGDFSFSQNFNFFYDQLEKSNLFLEGIIETADKPMDDKKVEWLFQNPIGDGGQWTGVVDIIKKYGLVPSEVFPESHNSENTGMMSRFLRRMLKEDGLKLREMYTIGKDQTELRKEKYQMLSDIYRILAITLGEPPTEFVWRYKDKDGNLSPSKTYTPKSFYNEFVNMNLDDYVMFMNDPTRDFGKVYEIENDRHMYEGQNWKYINLEADKIKTFAVASIKDNEAMYFSCDVGKQLDKDRGYLDVNNYDYGALFGLNFGMDKAQRIKTFESGSTHGMALMAVDIQDGKPMKWLLENSWGNSGFEGHLIMTDAWFDEYMFRLVINKKYIDAETLKLLETEAVMLPPWDPMFLPDN